MVSCSPASAVTLLSPVEEWIRCGVSDEAVPCGEPVCQPEISTDEQRACVITADRAGVAPGLMLGFMLVNYWRERN